MSLKFDLPVLAAADPSVLTPQDRVQASHSEPLFSVIIVNWNGGGFIEDAIASLSRQTFSDFELIVVDNASADGSADLIDLSSFRKAELIREARNHGFSGGVNIGARRAKGRYLALLNPDCIAEPDWLEQLSRAVILHPDVAMFASTQISMQDNSRIDGAGDNYFIIGIPWRGGFGLPVSELPETGACFSPCGAGAVIRRETFLNCGGFDEDFFCYCEDVDLGFRLRLLGERCVFWRPAVVQHFGSALSGKTIGLGILHGTRNRILTHFKNMPTICLILTLPVHILASVYFYLRTPRGVYRDAMGAGLVQGLRALNKTRAKRRSIQKSRKASTFDILRAMSWNPIKLRQSRSDVRCGAKRTHRGHVASLTGENKVVN